MAMKKKTAVIKKFENQNVVSKTVTLSQIADGTWQYLAGSHSYQNKNDYWASLSPNYAFRTTEVEYFFNEKEAKTYGQILSELTERDQETIIEQLTLAVNTMVESGQTGYIAATQGPSTTVPYDANWLAQNIDGVIVIDDGNHYWLPTLTISVSSNVPISGDEAIITDRAVVIVLEFGVAAARDYNGSYFSFYYSTLYGALLGVRLEGKYYAESKISQVEYAIRNAFNSMYITYSVPLNYSAVSSVPPQYEISQIGTNLGLMFYFKNTRSFTDGQLAPRVLYASGAIMSNYGRTDTDEDQEGTDPWEEPDPYEDVDPKPEPGGDPDPNDPEDPVPEPSYPPIDGASIGIYKVFKPSSSQLRQIAAKLWDPNAWDAIKQMFTNPMDALMGLAIVPVEPLTGNAENVYLGRYNTQVSVPRVTNDYVTVNCGSVQIKKFYGSYLDHDPYTTYTLYLPYVGEIDINADEITGKTVTVKYHCNVVTGDTVAIVLIDNRCCYTAMGNIIRQLPLSQTDFSSVIQTAVSAAATILTTSTSVAGSLNMGAQAAALENPMGMASAAANTQSAVAQGVASTLNKVASTKLAYKHAGKIGQGAAQISVQKPFFTVIRPNLSLPEGTDGARNSSQKKYTGYPANYIDTLSNFHGFTIVEDCKLSAQHATDAEIAEALEIMKGGVIL